jgi:hypothetical protein
MRRKTLDPRTPKLTVLERSWLKWLLRLGLHCSHMQLAAKWWPPPQTVTHARERRVLYGLRLLEKKGLVGFDCGVWCFLPLVDLLIEQGVVPYSQDAWKGTYRMRSHIQNNGRGAIVKTREEVESLKREWLKDGCWDIESTAGFEEYRDELLAFSKETQAARQAKWEADAPQRAKRLQRELSRKPVHARPVSRDEHSGDRPEMVAAQEGLTLREWFAGQGLTLREWFAGQALASIRSMEFAHGSEVGTPAQRAARLAVEIADALLAELAKDGA